MSGAVINLKLNKMRDTITCKIFNFRTEKTDKNKENISTI